MTDGHYKRRCVDYELTSEFSLPAHYYRSEDIYQQEVDKIFTKRWLMACREEELAEPGDYVTVPIGPESLILSIGLTSISDDRECPPTHADSGDNRLAGFSRYERRFF